MAAPHPGGRPTLLTPEVLEDVRRLLPTALYLETVADYLGCDRTTWRKWLRRGSKEAARLERKRARPKESEAVYLEFFHTVKKALAGGEMHDLGVIRKASQDQANDQGEVTRQGQWQAAAWRLERRFPAKWGRKDRLEHVGKDGKAIVLSVQDREQAERELEEWRRARNGGEAPPDAPGEAPP
jgi:hypothetical protein